MYCSIDYSNRNRPKPIKCKLGNSIHELNRRVKTTKLIVRMAHLFSVSKKNFRPERKAIVLEILFPSRHIAPMSEYVLSLTTIPSRAKYLGQFLSSIGRQTLQPARIELNLPVEYKRRNLGVIDRSQIPSDFTVFNCEDFGPATKILPTLKRHKDENTQIIYCDDDRIFDRNWALRLTNIALQHPKSAIADECNAISAIDYRYENPSRNWQYRLKRAASFGLYDPYKSSRKTEWDIVEGFGGVLVRPAFFSAQVFDIPTDIWAVDDIWLSANLAANHSDILWTQRTSRERSRSLRVSGKNLGRLSDALFLSTFDGLDRAKADYQSVRKCQEMFGIWK